MTSLCAASAGFSPFSMPPCGVRYKPQTVTVNGKEEPIKDDLGRILYSSEIMTDDSGTPKWKMNRPDVSAFFALIKRYGSHSVNIE
jgi:hypothetical protein